MHARYAGRWCAATALKARYAGQWKDGTCYTKKNGRWVLAWPQVDLTYTLDIVRGGDRYSFGHAWVWTVPAGVYRARMTIHDPFSKTDREVRVAPGSQFSLLLKYDLRGAPLPGTWVSSSIRGKAANGSEVVISPSIIHSGHLGNRTQAHIKIQSLPPD